MNKSSNNDASKPRRCNESPWALIGSFIWTPSDREAMKDMSKRDHIATIVFCVLIAAGGFYLFHLFAEGLV